MQVQALSLRRSCLETSDTALAQTTSQKARQHMKPNSRANIGLASRGLGGSEDQSWKHQIHLPFAHNAQHGTKDVSSGLILIVDGTGLFDVTDITLTGWEPVDLDHMKADRSLFFADTQIT